MQAENIDMSSNTLLPPAKFSYPPLGSNLQFNYIDSVVTSWLVFDPNPTECFLSVWYWPNTDPWRVGMSNPRPNNRHSSKLELESDD